MSKQLAFSIQAGRCVQCNACEVACKAVNSVELGPKWRKVVSYWEGDFPQVINIALSKSCMHCSTPACVSICPAKAISKRAEDGIVTVDSRKCIGCKQCGKACPYGAPQYGSSGKMQKCNLCLERLAKGKEPACVATCPAYALGYGAIDEIIQKGAPQSATILEGPTKPSFVLIPAFKDSKVGKYIEAFFPR